MPAHCEDLIKGALFTVLSKEGVAFASHTLLCPFLGSWRQPAGPVSYFPAPVASTSPRGHHSGSHSHREDLGGLRGVWTSVPSTRHFTPWPLSLKPLLTLGLTFSVGECSAFKAAVLTLGKLPFQQAWQVRLPCWPLHQIQKHEPCPWDDMSRPCWAQGKETLSHGLAPGVLSILMAPEMSGGAFGEPVNISPIRRV